MVPEIRPVLRVQPGARLVQEQHFGLVHDPERHVESPTLATRVGLHAAIGELVQVEDLHQHLRPRDNRGTIAAVEAALEYQVLATGGQLVGAAELADVADARPDLLRPACHVDPGHCCRAALDGQQRRKHAQRGRLPGSVRAEEPEYLSAPDLDADSADGLDAAALCVEALAQIDGRNDRFQMGILSSHRLAPVLNSWNAPGANGGGVTGRPG